MWTVDWSILTDRVSEVADVTVVEAIEFVESTVGWGAADVTVAQVPPRKT